MNPFLERKHELAELHLKKDKIASDIKKIKEELEKKIEAVTDVHKNMLLDTELKIKEFPRLCDHTDENGDLATSKEHKIIVPSIIGDITLVKQMCSLCGGTVSEQKVEIKKSKDAKKEFITWYVDSDDDDFIDTMTFDPNFSGSVIGSVINSNYIIDLLNNNNNNE